MPRSITQPAIKARKQKQLGSPADIRKETIGKRTSGGTPPKATVQHKPKKWSKDRQK